MRARDLSGIASGTIVSQGGMVTVVAGGDVISTMILSGGTLIVLPGANVTGATSAGGTIVLSSGLVDLTSGGTVFVLSGVVSGLTVSSGGVLEDSNISMSGIDLKSGATIEMMNVEVSNTSVSFGSATDVLTVSESGSPYASFQLTPDDDTLQFNVTSAGDGTTLIITDVACYARGTMICADQGDVAIEYRAQYPDEVAGSSVYCALRVEAGEGVDAVKARINARAAVCFAGAVVPDHAPVLRVVSLQVRAGATRIETDETLVGVVLDGVRLDEWVAIAPAAHDRWCHLDRG